MITATRRPLADYLVLQYPFHAEADPDGGYVVLFPDLPGCMTQVETLDELPDAAEEARRLWIETEYEAGEDIPLPSKPQAYSGKFNVRLPKGLHRALAESAAREGVSLNQYVVAVLAQGDARYRAEQRMVSVFSLTIGSAGMGTSEMVGSTRMEPSPMLLRGGIPKSRGTDALSAPDDSDDASPLAARIYQQTMFRT